MRAGRQYGKRFKQGIYCIIEPDVEIGDNVTLGHHVTLKNGTRIGNNVDIADYCCTTGICIIGDGVNIRTRSTISKGVIINDCAFIGAGIMTSHTKNIYHHRPDVPKQQLITNIGYGALIGSHSNLRAGLTIGNNVIIGYASSVLNDIVNSGLYYGNPLKRQGDVPDGMFVDVPITYKSRNFDPKLLKKYLPYVLHS